jgi:hypothetical protein
MIRTKKGLFFLSILAVSVIGASPLMAAKKEKIIIPVQLKPERLELLNKIANEKIRDEDYSYKKIEEISEVLQLIEKEEKITSNNLKKINKAYRSISVSMSPSSDFETINMVPNYSTTLVFVDKMGNPWSINKFIVGSAQDYSPEHQSPNILTFSPNANIANSNLTILFKGAKLPIAFDLVVNSEEVDYITEIKVNEYGDQSPKEEYIEYYKDSGKQDLSYLSKNEESFMGDIIANTRPSGFEEKHAFNKYSEIEDDFRIFHKNKFLYIRTSHQVFSPAPIKQKNSADRLTKVFKIPFMSTIIINKNGKMETLKIK